MRAHKGDEIFFHKNGVPTVGKVKAHGKHGCTVECGGQHHRVKWHQVAGHKKRAAQNYRVIEHGEDGMIVENQDGARRFIATPPEAKDEYLELDHTQKVAKPQHTLNPDRAGKG